MTMAKSDDEAAAFYEDAAHLEPAGPPEARNGTHRLSSHIPVRFTGAAIRKIKTVADEDGLTVSSWIRRVVEREADRRLAAHNMTLATADEFQARVISQVIDGEIADQTDNANFLALARP